MEEFFHIDNLSDPENLELQHNVILALRANNLMFRDQDYVVSDDQVLIVDSFTGRIMPGRRYSDGLHQAIEVKGHVQVIRESMNLATHISFFLFKTVDYIVPNSQTQTSFMLENFPWLSDKTKMIRNYLDLDVFCPSLRPLPDNNRVIVVGRVVEQKNPIRFIEAIAKVASKGFSFTVDWYGNPHPMSFLADCNHKLKELGIERMFHFYPSTSNIVEKYHNASVFILPSIYEGFPNVLCEAMGCGLPVLASNVCDNGNILADGDNGFLFDPYNVDDISDKLIRFLSQSKDEKLRMGKRSRELAMELFSREKFIQAYMNLINS